MQGSSELPKGEGPRSRGGAEANANKLIDEREPGCFPREGGAHALMAMSTQRKTLDFEREFDELKAKLPQR